MRPINVEITMGHNIGISSSYYRPQEKEVLDDYLNAVDLLSINDDKRKLQAAISEIAQRSKEEIYGVQGRLYEKEKEIELLRHRDTMNTDAISALSDQLQYVMNEIEILKKETMNDGHVRRNSIRFRRILGKQGLTRRLMYFDKEVSVLFDTSYIYH